MSLDERLAPHGSFRHGPQAKVEPDIVLREHCKEPLVTDISVDGLETFPESRRPKTTLIMLSCEFHSYSTSETLLGSRVPPVDAGGPVLVCVGEDRARDPVVGVVHRRRRPGTGSREMDLPWTGSIGPLWSDSRSAPPVGRGWGRVAWGRQKRGEERQVGWTSSWGFGVPRTS